MKRSLTAFLALVMTTFGGAAHAQQVEGIAALVNDYPITTVDVRNRMRLIIVSSGIQPTEEALLRIQQEALRSLIEETLQIQAALEYEVEVEPAEIDAAIANIAVQNNADPSQIASELAASGVDIATLRRQLEAEIAWQIIVSGVYNNRIRISNQHIEQTLERVAASAAQPQYRIAEIFIEIPLSADDSVAQQRAVAVMTQLSQGAAFQAVAQQFSDAPSAANGGDIGWLLEGQMRPEVAQIARILEPGQLSRPFRVPGGLMIIALIDRRESSATVQYELVQATLPSSRLTDETRSSFASAIDRVRSCDGIDAALEPVEGAFASRLGQISLDALLPEIADRLRALGPGENTGVLDTSAGQQVYFVCDRAIGGPGVPTPDEIERQLRNQQLSMFARRWLRDLQRDATIEIR
ncbi:peptidylprolyl isomerase [Hyphobacterium sp.]|uniref:peptidylprolyl isomerase n=1 Tax=Hyphobacterium sp. TaxID=2004662 RepID=UPI003B52489E